MTRFAITAAAAAVCTALTAGPAGAQISDEDAAAAVEIRHSVFTILGWNMDPLAPMMRNQAAFDIDRIRLSAERMSAVAPMIVDVFAVDTRGADVETEARDGIWESRDAFNDKAADLVDALGQLKEAAAGGERGPTIRAIGAVGQACGSCHDDYRDE